VEWHGEEEVVWMKRCGKGRAALLARVSSSPDIFSGSQNRQRQQKLRRHERGGLIEVCWQLGSESNVEVVRDSSLTTGALEVGFEALVRRWYRMRRGPY